MSLRTWLFSAITDTPSLVALGVDTENVFAAQAFDGLTADPFPEQDFFLVYRINGAVPGMLGNRGTGRVRQATVQLWAYDKQRDFELRISPVLKAWEEMMDSVETADLAGGWLIGSNYEGQSDDGWDDVYERIVRYSAYTLTYTGQ